MKIITIVSILIGMLFFLGHSVFAFNQTTIYAENGLLENIQVIILIVSFAIFLLPVIYQKREDKLILLFFSFLCLSFVLREVDVEHLAVPSYLIFIGSGMGRNAMLVIGAFSIATYAILNGSYYKKLVPVFINSTECLLIVMAGILLCIGAYFDKEALTQHPSFFEEAFELSGYVALLLSSSLLFKKQVTAKCL